MKSGIPKQFIPVGDKPVLMHTISTFRSAYNDIHIVVVLPERYIKLWKDMCTEFSFNISHSIIAGGKTRFHSVQKGLKLIKGDCIIGVHDGVRPFVSMQTIKLAYDAACDHGAAIPVIELNDSLRMISNGSTVPANRSLFRIVQTPQCFRSHILQEAYKTGYKPEFTDDAAVVEAAGFPVSLTSGNFENIKITRSIDLAYAEVLTKKRFII